MVTQIIVCYSSGGPKTILEHTTQYSLKKMGDGLKKSTLMQSVNSRLNKVKSWLQPFVVGYVWRCSFHRPLLTVKHYSNTTCVVTDHMPPFTTTLAPGYINQISGHASQSFNSLQIHFTRLYGDMLILKNPFWIGQNKESGIDEYAKMSTLASILAKKTKASHLCTMCKS